MDRLTKRDKFGQALLIGDSYSERLDTAMKALDRLGAYEDTGLEPEQIVDADKFLKENWDISLERLKEALELIKAKDEGRIAVFPFVAMMEQSLQDGEMKPQRDQCFNGRYAVVYLDKGKWKSPLIDICGAKKYDREEAETRREELIAKTKEQQNENT